MSTFSSPTKLIPPDYVWLNGKIIPWAEATVPVIAMGASGGLAVFEGMMAYWNSESQALHVICLEDHIKRLYESMKIVRMEPDISQDEMRAGMTDLLRRCGPNTHTYIRPVAFYDGIKAPMLRDTFGRAPDLLIWTRPFTSRLMQHRTKNCCVSSWTRISDNVVPPRIKCMSNYQNNRMALMPAVQDGYDDVFILDDRGKVTEAATACLFLIRDGKIATSPVTSGILESITRSVVIRLLQEELDMAVEEREIDRTELYLADEIFLVGTAEEISCVVSVDRLPVGHSQPGSVYLEVERLYNEAVLGRMDNYSDMRTTILASSYS